MRSLLADPRKMFLLLAPLLFATYALLTPPFQSFDENQHLYRAWQVSTLQLRAEPRGLETGGELPPGLADAAIKELGSTKAFVARTIRPKPLKDIFATNTPFGIDQTLRYTDFKGAAVYSFAGYIPQALIVTLGHHLNWSVEWTLRAGRLVNAAIAVGLIGLAIGLLPFGKWVMASVALLPPAAAAASNFGQDGFLLGTSSLLIALGLKAVEERGWTRQAIIIATPAAIAAATIKFVYLPLTAISLFLWPRTNKPLHVFPPLGMMVVAAVALALSITFNFPSMVLLHTGLPTVGEQVARIVADPLAYLMLVAHTYALTWSHLTIGLYTFGDSTVLPKLPAWLAGIFGVTLAIAAGEEVPGLSRALRLWLLTVFAGIALAITTALYVTYTPTNFSIIRGMQGRYFLPILSLLGIALMRRGSSSLALQAGSLALLCLSHVLVLETFVATFYPA